MLGFEYRTPWELPDGYWRCWVCDDCRIVSYHHLAWCPTCGRRLRFDRDYSSRLEKKYPNVLNGGDYRPYEWNPELTDTQQPWRVNGFVDATRIWESKEQQEHDTHGVSADTF